MSELKLTDRLRAILTRYGARPPPKARPVTHFAYGTTAMIPPVVFAAYEAGVKAQYLCWKSQVAERPPGGDEHQAAKDYRYLAGLISRAGQYLDLLD
ncbi:MAG: hypothetical protein C0467_23260 [Planctomycetaceae bacterium]|nr:hypothetical protein [Planctomycetaceae bacterium]